MTIVERIERAKEAKLHLEAALAALDELGWHQSAAMVDHSLHLLSERQRAEAEQVSAA